MADLADDFDFHDQGFPLDPPDSLFNLPYDRIELLESGATIASASPGKPESVVTPGTPPSGGRISYTK